MEEQEQIRVRLPRSGEVLGQVEESLGASRFKVACTDGRTRICRIPGKFRKRVNVRIGDILLIEPWPVEPDEKGDVIWLYNKTQMSWLRRRGFVK